MTTKTTRVTVTVRYWRGTTQLTGKAYTYRGAMRIAAKNQNLHGPTFYHEDRELFDDGNGLAYADEAENGERVYAV